MLEDIGHTVVPASSGVEALDVLRRYDSVDLVITDQVMPHMTGIELADVIRKEWPDLPVVIATGYAEVPSGTGTSLPKLAKPFTQGELAKMLASIVPRTRKLGRVLPFRASAMSQG